MKFELDDYHRNISDEDLINELQRLAIELGKNTISVAENNER